MHSFKHKPKSSKKTVGIETYGSNKPKGSKGKPCTPSADPLHPYECAEDVKKKPTPHERDVARLSTQQARDTTLTEKILQKVEQIMATVAELKEAIATLKTDITAEKAEVQAKLKELADKVQALTDQLASGTGITAADLDEVKTMITDLDASVKDISEPEAPPA